MAERAKKIKWKGFKEMEIPDGDLSIYELISGEIVKRASPNILHQKASGRLFFELESYNRNYFERIYRQGSLDKEKSISAIWGKRILNSSTPAPLPTNPNAIALLKNLQFSLH